MAQYDLSRRLIPNLDRHLVRPILEFLESECSLYPAEDLMKARYELLKGSNMINYLGPLVQSIKGGPEDVMPEGESTTLLELSGWEGRI
jgi:translation initiation factor 3 subunit E